MTLSKLIRKRDSLPIATATTATQTGKYEETVARVSTVAVARPTDRKQAPMNSKEEKAVMGWLESIDERDNQMIQRVLTRCQEESEALAYFLWRAARGDA